MTPTAKAKTIRIRIEEGRTGLFFATSPDLKGLLVAEPTIGALHDAIPKAIKDLYEACGAHVVVTMLEDGKDDFEPWVAFPAEVARRELAAA